MMNDTTKECNGKKNTYTNKECHTLRLGGSWNLVNWRSTVGGGWSSGGGRGWERRKTKKYFLEDCPIREVFLREKLPHWPSIQIGNARLQKFSHAMMRQLLLHSILLSYFTSKIFHFFFQQIKASKQLLI